MLNDVCRFAVFVFTFRFMCRRLLIHTHMCACLCVQEPGVFDMELVNTQLHYSGIMETIHIRKEGYPIKMLFSSFLSRSVPYSCR